MCEHEFQYVQRRYEDVWYASFNRQAFSKKSDTDFRNIDTNIVCKQILEDACCDPPMISLKSAGRLVHGVTCVYGRQVTDLYDTSYGLLRAQASYNAICRQAERSETIIEGKKRGIKRKADDEVPLDDDIHYLMDFEENLRANIDFEMESFAVNTAARDQVTLRENVSTRVSQFDILDDDMDFEPLTEDCELFDFPEDSFDPDGPLRASTPIPAEELPENDSDSHQSTDLNSELFNEEQSDAPSQQSQSQSNMESMEVTNEPSSTSINETIHNESVPMEITMETQTTENTEAPTEMEIDKENQAPNFVAPSLTTTEFTQVLSSKKKKKKSRKSKWGQRDTVTEITIDTANLSNDDILKNYPPNVDLKLAIREAQKIALKRLKLIRPANELLTIITPRPVPLQSQNKSRIAVVKGQKRPRTETAPILPPAKRSKENIAPVTEPEVVIQHENPPPVELEAMFENLATSDQQPAPIRRTRSEEFARPMVATSPLKRSKTVLDFCREDDWQNAKVEWSQVAMLEKLIPEMINAEGDMNSAVSFTSVKKQMKNKKEATIAFTSLINLKAKGFINIQNNENSIEIMEIKRGAKLQDPKISLESTIASFSDGDFM